jgi:hypothetical protein
MKTEVILTLIIGAAGILLLAGLLGGQVLLYSAEGNAVTSDHMDASTILPMTTEESETLLPLMDDLLMLSNNVVLEIRADDTEAALRTMQAYERSLNRLNTNSIKVRVTGTDINEFRKEAAKMKEDMQGLLNNTERLRELQQLQIQYRDESNPGAVYELSYEGAALQREIEKITGQMLNSSMTLGDIAGIYARDNTSITSTYEAILDIRNATGSIIGEFGQMPKIMPEGSIELNISPRTVSYGDTVSFSGYAKYVPRNLSFYKDLEGWKLVPADTNGYFNESLVIQNISAGEHSLYILSGGVYSWLDTFTVLESPGYLNITEIRQNPGTNGTIVAVSGYLSTENTTPVRNAVVELYDENEGTSIANATTDSRGFWRAAAELPDGEYSLFAGFRDITFPVGETRSETVFVRTGTPGYYYILILAAGVVLAVFGFRYIMRLSVKGKPEVRFTVPGGGRTPAENYLPKRVRKLFVPPAPGPDTDAVRKLYRKTCGIVAAHEGISIRGKTPREFLAEVRNPPPSLPEFIRMYEHLHYADSQVRAIDLQRFEELSEKIISDIHEVET